MEEVRPCHCSDNTHSAQPLLEHHQAEEKFVIVLVARIDGLHEFAHRLGLEEAEHQRAFIQERFLKSPIQRRAKPVVHDVDGEPAFLASSGSAAADNFAHTCDAAICGCHCGS